MVDLGRFNAVRKEIIKNKFRKKYLVIVLGIVAVCSPPPVFAVETGTSTNQTANLHATNSITLRGSIITNWQGLTNSLDAFYIKNASAWSYYPAVSNLSLANKELTNVAALTLGGERRTNWPGQTITILAQGATLQWMNQPITLTEFIAATRHRTKIDLSGYNQARLTVVTAVTGAVNAFVFAQYSTNQSDWRALDGVFGPSNNICTPIGLKVGNWVNIETEAQQDVYIRLVGINGNGKADPSFGLITLQVK